jgi:hypothetical protein
MILTKEKMHEIIPMMFNLKPDEFILDPEQNLSSIQSYDTLSFKICAGRRRRRWG